MSIGDVFNWIPEAFSRFDADEMPVTVRGRVVYINHAHKYFTAEAIVNGYAIRESFSLAEK